VRLPGLYFAAFALTLASHAATFSVYSGASYQPVVAPNSWAVAFGSQMAQITAVATLTAPVSGPPRWLVSQFRWTASPRSCITSHRARLISLCRYHRLRSVNVVITNVASGATQTSTVNLQNTAVGIFTSNSSGAGPGAILNGVTGAAPPFLVVTPQNGGSDLRTRLAIYCTGLRYAGNPTQDSSVTNVAANVTAFGRDTAGNQYNFTVEYAGGSDPAFPGLDQVNIVLPAQLDGAGVVSLIVTAESGTSNTVTFQVNSLRPAKLHSPA